eukprot:TRINITY_DN48614_c0_g1_i1.p1 TRINITY_DN48614_c0_g1~~TRINITY_DN48614_c0_g1_i1.p1  ORF type:complete len:343 (-),score=66.91 TRINITY_DN48614_c0_g1_i1:229-1257(-)
MGNKQSIENGTPVRDEIEPFEEEDWIACDATSDLLTMESWTMVNGDLINSFSGNGFMIIPSTEELKSWIAKLRRARHYCVYREAPDHIKNSREAVYAAVCGSANALEFAPEVYQHDKDIVMAAVKRDSQVFEALIKKFKADREVALLAVRSDGKLLRHATESLHKDRQLVREALNTCSSALLLYPHECWDAELVLAAISKAQGYVFRSLMDNSKMKQIFGRRPFVRSVLERSPQAFQYASKALQADKELVLAAVKRDWQTLKYASRELRADLEVMKAAVDQSTSALEFAADSVKNNYDFALELVKKDPDALRFLSKKLRADDVISATAYASYVSHKNQYYWP